jgi:hypothetical protein
MKDLKSLFSLAILGFSLGASASDIRVYECGSLDNPYVTYSIQLDDDLVVLSTVHGSDRGLHSTTNSVMKHLSSPGETASYQAGGLKAYFVTSFIAGRLYRSVTLHDRHGHVAHCK